MATAHAGPRNDLDLDSVRRTLEAERDRLTHEIAQLDSLDETGGPAGERGELAHYDQHEADDGTETFQREQDLAMEGALKNSLAQVEHALHRLDQGTYGYCERCDVRIGKARLEALPYALMCIRCADDLQGQY